MTFVLDALHLNVLEGYVLVQEPILMFFIANPLDKSILFSKIRTGNKNDDLIITQIILQPGDFLVVNICTAFYGWQPGDNIHWCIDYTAVEPILFINKV